MGYLSWYGTGQASKSSAVARAVFATNSRVQRMTPTNLSEAPTEGGEGGTGTTTQEARKRAADVVCILLVHHWCSVRGLCECGGLWGVVGAPGLTRGVNNTSRRLVDALSAYHGTTGEDAKLRAEHHHQRHADHWSRAQSTRAPRFDGACETSTHGDCS